MRAGLLIVKRTLTTALLVVIGLWLAAPAGAAERPIARTIDDLTSQLRADPVLVHPVLGAGDTAGSHDRLSALAARVGVPVFVVLAVIPTELKGAEQPAEQAAALLRQELGDGLYIIMFDEGIDYARGFGAAATLELDLGYRAIRTAEAEGPEEYNRTTAVFDASLLLHAAVSPGQEISDATLRDLMDEPWAFIATESTEYADQVARRWVYTLAAALAIVIAGLTLSRVAVAAPMPARARRNPSPTSPRPDAPDVRQAISRAQARFDTLSPARLGSPHASAADDALRAADAAARTGKDLDEVGAWVLAMVADRELDRIDEPSLRPYRPCVVNPLHGEAAGTVRLVGTTLDAPACRSCAGAQGTFLEADTWRGARPYLDTDTVWSRTGFGALVDDLASQVLDQPGRRK